ncbi:zinc ABC transporter substrate-binding protein [Roseicyclus mahoneyensis]|uniref:High-affinity zinc uptake system protein ZnuA n=1 Tax=Roseicyclus mahoneyensis TaxID=164332 RepID=A0A316GL73_9RHOB|nr:zinc ABC transporter substrate-binding protein [Roseicyclus mahoneyensis]PWK55577.1 zinc transport system substrate-binding protein [Roseicyclus mahoneyensis]
MRAKTLTALPLLMAGPALADVPRVAVDIAPVHALVAQVMDGVGTPDLVLPPGASPHGYAMRPSEAQALQDADLVIWVGPELTPWLAGPLDTIAGGAARLDLLEVEGIVRLGFREGATFEAHSHDDEHAHEAGHEGHGHEDDNGAEGDHDHDHGDHAHEDHAHEDHAHEEHAHEEHAHEEHAHEDHGHGDHAHEEHAHDDHAHDDHGHDDHAHDDHAHDDHGHDDHAHDGTDPHAWLDPVNAGLWLDAIAAELSRLDPENAAAYAANAIEGRAALEVVQAGIAARMEPLSGGFIVFHDAYHYFEARFGIEAAGAISMSDASDPGPARVAEIRDLVAAQGISCVFVEPQFNRGMVDAVFEGTGVRISVIDPLGVGLEIGAGLYPALLDAMAASFEDCLGQG